MRTNWRRSPRSARVPPPGRISGSNWVKLKRPECIFFVFGGGRQKYNICIYLFLPTMNGYKICFDVTENEPSFLANFAKNYSKKSIS